jgi:hypothetical protein
VSQIGIPSDAIVPYANQMVILAEIYRLLRQPSSEQLASIRRWFSKTSSSGYFGGWNTGAMAADRVSVASFALGRSTEISVDAPLPIVDLWERREFRANGAHSKLLAILMSYHRPRDLLTGQLIDLQAALSWVTSKEYHHVVPQNYLKRRGIPPRRINALANIVMLSSGSNKQLSDKAPSEYLKLTQRAAGGELDTWLATNMIDGEAYSCALADDYDGFLRARARTIQKELLGLTT